MHFIQLQGERCVIVILGKFVLIMREVDGAQKHLLSSSTSTGVIVATALCENNRYLCCAYSDKIVTCWDFSSSEITENGFKAAKKPTALACTKFGSDAALLVSDKFGDVYATDLPAMRKQVKLLGHTASVITDMVMLPHAIISADRDEKIRITNFPQTSVISSYCLAHTDVVSSLCLSGDFLLSAGLDHRICVWQCSDFTKISECILDTLPAREIDDNNAEDAEDEAAGEDDEEVVVEDDGRVDAAAAGPFPCKLIAVPTADIAIALLRNSTRVKILSTAGGVVQDTFLSIELPDVPLDCTVIDNNRILFLLPKPHYVASYRVARDESGIVDMKPSDSLIAWNSTIGDVVLQNDIELQQRVSFVDETNPTAAPYSGMQKHNLSKPFSSVDTTKRKNKRSRKK